MGFIMKWRDGIFIIHIKQHGKIMQRNMLSLRRKIPYITVSLAIYPDESRQYPRLIKLGWIIVHPRSMLVRSQLWQNQIPKWPIIVCRFRKARQEIEKDVSWFYMKLSVRVWRSLMFVVSSQVIAHLVIWLACHLSLCLLMMLDINMKTSSS